MIFDLLSNFPKRISQIFLLVLIAFSCSDEGNDTSPKTGTVHGKAMFADDKPAANTSVLLDDVEVVKTANDGSFSIETTFGSHELVFRSGGESGLFSISSYEVSLTASSPEVELLGLLLPNPVGIRVKSQDGHNIQLVWDASLAVDFREYRLYMHYTEAFDEETATLLKTTTFKDDTLFSINDGGASGIPSLDPGKTYYFRVFVMNSFGKLGGSNILPVTHQDMFDKPMYKLTEVIRFSPPAKTTGIAYDGKNLWFSTVTETGGYYDVDDISVTKYDYQTGSVIKQFNYSNYVAVHGITFDADGNLWMVQDGLKAIDTLDGSTKKTFALRQGVNDITFDGQHLRSLDEWGNVEAVDPKNGIGGPGFVLPLGSGWRGFTWRSNKEFWGLHWVLQKILVFNEAGDFKGSVATSAIDDCSSCFEAGLYLTFLDENHIAVSKWDKIIIFRIDPI